MLPMCLFEYNAITIGWALSLANTTSNFKCVWSNPLFCRHVHCRCSCGRCFINTTCWFWSGSKCAWALILRNNVNWLSASVLRNPGLQIQHSTANNGKPTSDIQCRWLCLSSSKLKDYFQDWIGFSCPQKRLCWHPRFWQEGQLQNRAFTCQDAPLCKWRHS